MWKRADRVRERGGSDVTQTNSDNTSDHVWSGAAEKDIAAVATVLVTSEDPHTIDYAFDGQRGPGASRWIAEQSGEQTVILAFDTPQTIHKILVEVEESETSRTQEMAVSISQNGGQTYRELIRQEYNFSHPAATLEREEWSINADAISHLQLRIKPDKGGKDGRATLTTLALEQVDLCAEAAQPFGHDEEGRSAHCTDGDREPDMELQSHPARVEEPRPPRREKYSREGSKG